MEFSGLKELDDTHLALLSLFLNPRPLDLGTWQEIWSNALNRSYKSIIDDFIRHGILKEANTEQKLSASLRVSDLKQILKEHDLRVSGKKEELISCLVENLPDEAEKFASSKSNIYICTELGSAIANEYKNKADLRRQNAEEEVKILLKQNKITEAAEIINAFIKSLPSPMAHEGAMPSDAQAILEINSISGITKEELDTIKLEAATSAIWGKGIRGPKPFLSEAYKRMFRKSALSSLKSYKEAGLKEVTIIAAIDSCPTCMAASDKNYEIDKELLSPTLPIKECTHEIGWCRCCYAPWNEDWAKG